MTATDFRIRMDALLTEVHDALRQGDIEAMLVLAVRRREDGEIEVDVQFGALSPDCYEVLCDAVAETDERLHAPEDEEGEEESPTIH